MRACDEHTFRQIGVPSRAVMETAGRSVEEAALRFSREGCREGVTVLAGAGNNGGDGYVAARFLAEAKLSVEVIASVSPDTLQGDALAACRAWQASGGAIHLYDPASPPAFRRG